MVENLNDQLAAIGKPVDEANKVHWFLRGLGPAFTNFQASYLTRDTLPRFRDLLARAESYSMFHKPVPASTPTTVAFTAQPRQDSSHGYRFPPNSSSNNGPTAHTQGPSNNRNTHNNRNHNKRRPRCQLCYQEGHYANSCPQRFVQSFCSEQAANLAEAFATSVSVASPSTSDWFMDTGASAHMTANPSSLDLFW